MSFRSLGFEQIAVTIVDEIANLLVGPAESLERACPERGIVLPRDTYAHENVQTEWWYYSGHLFAEDRPFGFELVFFKRRTDQDRFGRILPMRLLGQVNYYAHFAVTDVADGKFRYSHRRSIGAHNAGASVDRHKVWLGDWSARELHSQHLLFAKMNSTSINLALRPVKPLVLQGAGGISYKDEGEASYYLSYSRMLAEGELTVAGNRYDVTGLGWMDHEFGSWTMRAKIQGWDWFAIQLDDGQEIMAFHIRDSSGQPTRFSAAALIDSQGQIRQFGHDAFRISILGRWKSPQTGTIYPSGWSLSIPAVGAELEIIPLLRCQELDTRGSTMIIYWEGACSVRGKLATGSVRGRSYVELVGYDRSHEALTIFDYLLGEIRFRSLGLHLMG